MLFAGATTRRLGANEARLSFPFTVTALTAGSGSTASTDDQNLAEFWAPLWTRAIGLTELRSFLAEGRATLTDRAARDGLEFAAAVSTLGAQRGVPEYQRFALLQREPRNPKKAIPPRPRARAGESKGLASFGACRQVAAACAPRGAGTDLARRA